jgi:hypothetical protein
MPATVIVNMMTVVHKGSNGINMAFPDVCKTPSPAGPIPIPYPNIAMSTDTDKGSSTVKMDGNPIMIKSSNYRMSTGDEAGAAQGVMSNKIKGKAYPKMYSFDVKADGENVFRLLDIMLQNGGSPTNTPPAPNMQPPNVVLPGRDPDDMKVMTLKWDRAEACCGDEVWLPLQTQNMSGLATTISVTRNASVAKAIGLVQAPVAAEKSRPKWKVRRGPQQKDVKLTAKVSGIGGPKQSSNQLKVKGVADAKEMFSESRTAYGMVWAHTPGYGWSWLGKKVYGWDCTYERKIEEGVLVITKKIQFAPKPHVVTKKRPGTLTSKKRTQWKRQIESIWDRKYKLHRKNCKRGAACDCAICGGCMFPIRVVCEWGGGHGDSVSLFAGAPSSADWGKADLWWYSHTWWEANGGAPATVRAHEFGHLIGMYDEYAKGAVNPSEHGSKRQRNARVEDPSSIMNAGSTVYPRHFEEFKAWFDKKASSVIGDTVVLRY